MKEDGSKPPELTTLICVVFGLGRGDGVGDGVMSSENGILFIVDDDDDDKGKIGGTEVVVTEDEEEIVVVAVVDRDVHDAAEGREE